MRTILTKNLVLIAVLLLAGHIATAQESKVSAKLDANRITVGDQARLFLEAVHNPKSGALQWAAIPDTFNSLEVVEKGKIDTSRQGDIVILRQRLLITGFDSGVFVIPRFQFSVIPSGGTAYVLQTDSFQLAVQTVAVDTTKAFKGIKGIIEVKSDWRDYLWLIIAGIILIALAIFVIWYFRKNKTVAPVIVPSAPKETLQQKYLRLLDALEEKKLWQNNRVESIKEYYTELTDILRVYIEERFQTPMLELTTDEILHKVRTHKEMNRHHDTMATILYTADLAKFARAQPTPAEHISAMEHARQFVNDTREVTINNTEQAS